MNLFNRRLVILVGPDYEDLELWYPRLRLIEAGAEVVVAGAAIGVPYRGKHGYPCAAGVTFDGVRAADFDGLVVPGGGMPDKLRRQPRALELARDFATTGKLVASICRGGLIPCAAGVYRGVRATGWPAIQGALERAGAVWVDAPVVVDRHFVSSRRPDDLPSFLTGILQVLGAGAPPRA